MSHFRLLAVCSLLTFAISLDCEQAQGAEGRKPNIVLFLADDK